MHLCPRAKVCSVDLFFFSDKVDNAYLGSSAFIDGKFLMTGGSGADLENYAERSCKVKDAGYLTGTQCLV